MIKRDYIYQSYHDILKLQKHRLKKYKNKEWFKTKIKSSLFGYLLLSPAILLLIIFVFAALVFGLLMSFFDLTIRFGSIEWDFTGVENYKHAFALPGFTNALKLTFIFAITVTLIQTIIALLISSALQAKIKCKKIFIVIYFLPTLTSSTALTLIFIKLFGASGPVSNFLLNIGIISKPVNFASDPAFALKIIMIMNIWSTVPMFVTIYNAAHKDISKAQYEAADIDGAGKVRKFINITAPNLQPITIFVVLNAIIGTLQMFDQSYIFTKAAGGDPSKTETITVLLYNQAFLYGNYGVAAAIAIMLAIVIFIAAFVSNYILGGQKNDKSK